MIKRGDRMYVQLAAIGECDANGKSVLSFGFKGKVIGEPERPLATLVVGFIAQIVELARYSSLDALKADLAELKGYVDSLEGSTSGSRTEMANGEGTGR